MFQVGGIYKGNLPLFVHGRFLRPQVVGKAVPARAAHVDWSAGAASRSGRVAHSSKTRALQVAQISGSRRSKMVAMAWRFFVNRASAPMSEA